MRRLNSVSMCLLISGFLGFSTQVAAQSTSNKKADENTSNLPAVLWHNPGNMPKLDLLYGAGRREHAPNPGGIYTFSKEDMTGSTPKFEVEDARGVIWKVKLGQEPQAETAATRLSWAAGYFVDEDYYLPELKVTGLPKLQRGQNFVSEGSIVHGARLERKNNGIKKLGHWDWEKNPFVGTREFNGLRVLMSLLNNWDLKAINNSVYQVDGTQRYLVSDLGATFGKTGNTMQRSKSEVKAYAESKFIEKKTATKVDFTMHSRPLFIAAIDVANYGKRSKMENVTKHIPRADAKWLGHLLDRLSEEQIRDCFRAAGYSPDEVNGYAKEVQRRIAELSAL